MFELATNCHLRVLPTENRQLFACMEEDRLSTRQLTTENFAKSAICDQDFDVAVDLIDAKFETRLQSFMIGRVRHLNGGRQYFLIRVSHLCSNNQLNLL